jgi:Holliday junction DNA helicase RuvB
MKVSVFAASNNIEKLSAPLQSRFFIVKLEPYTYEQFIEITEELLAPRIEEGLASIIAEVVWKKSQDIRDCVKIGTMAKSHSDVEFILSTFLK